MKKINELKEKIRMNENVTVYLNCEVTKNELEQIIGMIKSVEDEKCFQYQMVMTYLK